MMRNFFKQVCCKIVRDAAFHWVRSVLLLVLVLNGNLAYGQTGLEARPKKVRAWEDYEVRTLKEIAAQKSTSDNLGNKEETMTVDGRVLPSRVKLTYTGTKRRTPEIKKEVLRQWARLYAGFPEGYTGPYQTEMLFVEDHKKYWVAVRTSSLPLLMKELKKGDAVELGLIRVGSTKTPAEWELVLLLELFRKAV
jgi:hypothetical protein